MVCNCKIISWELSVVGKSIQYLVSEHKIQIEHEWYSLCFAYVLAENRCVVTNLKKKILLKVRLRCL